MTDQTERTYGGAHERACDARQAALDIADRLLERGHDQAGPTTAIAFALLAIEARLEQIEEGITDLRDDLAGR
jgi:hypothetical protein